MRVALRLKERLSIFRTGRRLSPKRLPISVLYWTGGVQKPKEVEQVNPAGAYILTGTVGIPGLLSG